MENSNYKGKNTTFISNQKQENKTSYQTQFHHNNNNSAKGQHNSARNIYGQQPKLNQIIVNNTNSNQTVNNSAIASTDVYCIMTDVYNSH